MTEVEDFSSEEASLIVRQTETVAEILRAKLALAEARVELAKKSPEKSLRIPPIIDTW